MLCAYMWPRYQVSVYRTIGPLVFVLVLMLLGAFCIVLTVKARLVRVKSISGVLSL